MTTAKICLATFWLALAITSQAQTPFRLLRLSDIGGNAPDTFLIKGIVRNVYQCPPCPPGAQCKPCIGDHLEVVEAKGNSDYIRLFTKTPTIFKKNKRYVFTVGIGNRALPRGQLQLVAGR